MLYPATWKKVTVDQSKVLKILLFRFGGATRYSENYLAFNAQNAVFAAIQLSTLKQYDSFARKAMIF